MSHSQFHRLLLKLRHAWLNLWDKHMTTGRINQVTISRTLYKRAWRLQRDCSHWLPLEFVTRRLFTTLLFKLYNNLCSLELSFNCALTIIFIYFSGLAQSSCVLRDAKVLRSTAIVKIAFRISSVEEHPLHVYLRVFDCWLVSLSAINLHLFYLSPVRRLAQIGQNI